MDNDYKELHKIVLNIYKEFKKICSEHRLHYFAISGTTLGAVLWNGIIPWDDDMDIAMPVEDYEKFIKICKTALPPHLSLSEYIWFGAKLHDNRTTFTNINYIHNPNRYNGIFIDIVPLIALPDNDAERTLFINGLKDFQKFGLLYDRYKDNEYSLSKLNQWRNTILTSHKFGSTKYVMDFSDPRYTLSSKGFTQPIVMTFENTTIPVSSNYQEDLSIQYGKYKKYPDKKTRQSIHFQQSILELHTPYSKIAEEFNCLPEWTKQMFSKKNDNEGFYLKNLYYNQDLLAKSEKEKEILNHKLQNAHKQLANLQQHPIKTFISSLHKKTN